jgi:RNA polymerase sigma-70 factor (ECF subfamily)
VVNTDAIIDGCRKNNRKAQNLLFNQFERKVFGICLRYASSGQEAKDIQQETFIKIFKSLLDKSIKIQSLEKWIHRIAVNTAIDFYRKTRKVNQMFIEPKSEEVAMPDILEMLHEEDLIKLVQNLATPYRTVLNLYIVEGFSHKEIAEMMKITESSSRAYLTRAKELLKESILPKHYSKVKSYG